MPPYSPRAAAWLKKQLQAAERSSVRILLRVEELERRDNPAPVPLVSGLANQTILLGDAASYTFTFQNNVAAGPGNTGFSPFIEVAVDTSGPDGATSLPLDGYGTPVVTAGGLDLIPVQTVNLTAAGQGYTNVFTGTSRTAPAGFGNRDTIYIYQLPFGSFTGGQSTAVTVALPTSNLADVGTALPITVTPGFRDDDAVAPFTSYFGAPVTANATPELWRLTKTYVGPEDETATGANYRRQYRLDVDIATGQTITNLKLTDTLPNTMQWTGATNTAQTVHGAAIAQNLTGTSALSTTPGGSVVGNYGSVTGQAGADASLTFEFYVPRDTTAGDEILPQPTPPLPDPATGTDSFQGADATRSSQNNARSDGNWTPIDFAANGRDGPANQPVTINPGGLVTPEHTLQEQSIATQKSVGGFFDSTTGAAVTTIRPGKTLIQYNIDFQVSDYYAFQNVTLQDMLGDGQRLFLGTAGALNAFPTLQVTAAYQFAGGTGIRRIINTAPFSAPNSILYRQLFTPGANSDPVGYAPGGPANPVFSNLAPIPGTLASTNPYDGSTFLQFNVSQELIQRIGAGGGRLVGGDINTDGTGPDNSPVGGPGLVTATTGRIVFYALVPLEYSDVFQVANGGTGDPSIDQFDNLRNVVPLDASANALAANGGAAFTGIRGDQIAPASINSPTATVIGVGTDDTAATIVIPPGVQTKTVYAINGTPIPTQGIGDTVFSVQAGDRITYRLTYTLPISRFEALKIVDLPPLPVMNVGAATLYSFDRTGDGSANPYEIEVDNGAGGLDTFFSTFNGTAGNANFPNFTPAPGASAAGLLTTDQAANSITLNFGDFDDPRAQSTTISLLLTLPVAGDPFVSDLFLTNQLRIDEGSTIGGSQSVEDLRRIQLVRPDVTISKGVVGVNGGGFTLGGITFTPAPNTPPTAASAPGFTGTVDSAAEATAIGASGVYAPPGTYSPVFVDARDRVRYAIVARNDSRADTYDVVIRDTIPAEFVTLPATFSGLNLAVRHGDGSAASTFAEVDYFARAASTANVNLAAVPLALDGVALAVNDLMLLKNQTTAAQNGVYRVTALDPVTQTATLALVDATTTARVAVMGGLTPANADHFFINFADQGVRDYYAIYDVAGRAFQILLSDNYSSGNANAAGDTPDNRSGALSRSERTPLVNAGSNPTVTTITNGSNAVVILYDLQVPDTVAADAIITNTATLTNYAAEQGGGDLTNLDYNQDGTPDPDPFDDATVAVIPTITKALVSTEVNQPGNSAGNAAGGQVVVGELVTYTITLTVPEGVTNAATILDTLDPGLAFVDITSATFNSAAVTSNLAGFSFANNATTNAATLQAAATIPAGPNGGGSVAFNLGTLTNTGFNNGAAETLTIVYRAVVLNVVGNQTGTALNNDALLSWTVGDPVPQNPVGSGTYLATGIRVSANNVTVVEPSVAVAKDVRNVDRGGAFGQTATGDNNDLMAYQVTLTSSVTTAFDISFSDQIPSSFNYATLAVFEPGGTGTGVPVTGNVRRNGTLVTALPAADFLISPAGLVTLDPLVSVDMEPGATIVLELRATFLGAAGVIVTNTANVQWTSLDGTITNRSPYNAASDERTGADGVGGALDDYAARDTADIDTPPVVRKTIIATSEPTTGPASFGTAGVTSGVDVAVGEVVRYRLFVSLGEGAARNFTLQDNIPTGMRFLNDDSARFAFLSTGGNAIASATNGTGANLVGGLGTPVIGTGGVDGNAATLATLTSAQIVGTFADSNVAPVAGGEGAPGNPADTEPDLFADGQDVFFRFGDLSNTDNDADAEFIVVEFNALVTNVTGNQAGATRANSFGVLIDTGTGVNSVPGYVSVTRDTNGDGIGDSPQTASDPDNDLNTTPNTPANSGNATVTVVEPALTVAKTVVTPTPASGDPTDAVTFQITITAGSGANTTTAFDVALSDAVPAGFENVSLLSGPTAGGSGAVTGLGAVSVTGNNLTLTIGSMAPGATVTFQVSATITTGATAPAPGSTLTNTADVTWTSLPGAKGSIGFAPFFGTLAATLGTSGTATGERTGADGAGGALNDYATSAAAQVTLNSHSLSGFVYSDANNNGVFDSGEAFIGQAITIQLTGTDIAGNAVNRTATVSATDGSYSFTGLRRSDASGYTVTEVGQPIGFLDGRDTPGTSGPGAPQFGGTGTLATDDRGTPTAPLRDAETITGVLVGAPSGPGNKTGISYNFGEVAPAQLGDFVWEDLNGNGIQDASETPALTGVSGAQVVLTGTDDTGRAVSLTTASGANGAYSFPNLRLGSYSVQFTAPTGYFLTVPNQGTDDAADSDAGSAFTLGTTVGSTGSYTITAGQNQNTVDAGLYRPILIGDFVWADLDANGVVSTAFGVNEATLGIPGVGVKLFYAGPDGTFQPGDLATPYLTTTTDASGFYSFGTPASATLVPGNYRVVIDPTPTVANPVITTAGTTTTIANDTQASNSPADNRSGVNDLARDFGVAGNGRIGDTVFIDFNKNGVPDPNEGVAGVTVTLVGDIDGDGTNETLTTTTNAAGVYLFPNLRTTPAGVGYTVTVDTGTLPSPDLVNVIDPDTANPGNSTSALTLTSAAPVNLAQDFGYRGIATVGDRVWIDQNRNDVQDTSEPGIPGATVVLRWAGQDGVLDNADDLTFTTTTVANGLYLFTELPVYGASDPYRVTVTTLPIAGLPATTDLDDFAPFVAPTTPGTAAFEVTNAAGGQDNRRDVDFGFDGIGGLSGTVYRDLNTDGVQQPNEAGIAGVTVRLTGVDVLGNPVLDPATGQPYVVTTDANGDYAFTTVVPGTYTITETQPPAYNDGIDTSGTLGGSPANDVISGIVVGPNQAGTEYNFGELGTFLSGTVFRDTNRDGARNAGEPGIPNVTLQLFAADGTTPVTNPATGTPYTVVTESSGNYSFNDILPGSYVVRETQPTGFADSPVGPTVRRDATVPLAGLTDQNFGEVLGSLSGRVYVDTNNNGTQQTGEPPLANIQVTLTGTDVNGPIAPVIAFTDAGGNYTFDNLFAAAGTGYTITEGSAAPYTDAVTNAVGTANGTAAPNVFSSIPLAAGQQGTSYNFGELPPALTFLSGAVYYDADRSATRTPGEPGIAGVVIALTAPGADGVFGTFDDTTTTTTTDAAGNYLFPNLTPGGSYSLTETQPGNYGSSTPNAISVPPLPLAGLTNQNFGETLGSLAGSVYFDTNKSGTRGTGEPGLPNVTVTLTGTAADGTTVTRSTTTDPAGNYLFPDLPAGTYTVSEPTQPTNFVDGLEALGSAGGAAGNDTFTQVPLSGGAVATNYDFGELGVPVSGTVFRDDNRDGTLTPGEVPIPGVRLELIDASGTVVGTTTTDANGNYLFPNVAPGDYTIREVQPAGYGNPLTGPFAPDTRPVAVTNAAVTNQNFGDTLSTLAGSVYVDANDDGVRQAEAGIPNVPVALDSAGADGTFGTADDVPNVRTTSTNATGDYQFTLLPVGTYRVREVAQPAPYLDGKDTAGSASGATSTDDQITLVPVGAGTDLTGYNFGELPPANTFISGTVYIDTNNNGTRDPGEPGIAGVPVTLIGPGGPVSLNTDAFGNYTFPNLTAGASYTVTETQPPAYGNGLERPTNTSTIASLPATGSASNNFGELPGRISGTVYLDRDASTNLTAPDNRLPGVAVALLDGAGNPVNNPLTGAAYTLTTDASGNYVFDHLSAGNYRVAETQPANYNQGTNTPGTGSTLGSLDQLNVALAAGGTSPGNNFGELGAPISGRVYLDANRDGVRQPGETIGLGGITITLLDSNGIVVATTQTAADGTYSFANLPPGTYTLVQTQPNTYASTTSNVIPVVLTAAGVTNQDYGEVLGSLAGSVFIDSNRNGSREATEPGIAGVTVTLTGTDVNGVAVTRTQPTQPDGSYLFTELPAGIYTVAETQPTAFADGQERVGTAGGSAATNDRFAAVPLTAGTVATAYTFGELPGSLSGFVYRDFDLSGARNTTGANPDTGIAGVVVTLTGVDLDGRTATRTATTAADGAYRFDDLGAGTYEIAETQPPLPSTVTNGFYDGADNLGSLSGTSPRKNAFAVTLPTAADGVLYNFGELPPADPFGYVFVDLNHSGTRDPGEPGIAGVAVTLGGTAFAGSQFARPLTPADIPGRSLTVFTDANGFYQFNPIPPGLYELRETQPAGYLDGGEQNGDPGAQAPTVGNDVFSNIVLNPFPVRGPFNFGELVPALPVPPVTPPLPVSDINKGLFLSSTPSAAVNMRSAPWFTNSVAQLGVPSALTSIGVAVATDAGAPARVRLFDFRTGAERLSFDPFPGFRGGVRVAVGDVNGDGIDDVVTAAGPGAAPHVKAFDGATGQLLLSFMAYAPAYLGGVNVAVGDINRDGFADIVTSAGPGVGPHVKVFDGRTAAEVFSFLAYSPAYLGGVSVAAGDVNGDGFADIVTGSGTGVAPHVKVFDGRNATELASFLAFAPGYLGGTNVAVADTNGDGVGEVVAVAASGNSSHVVVREVGGAGRVLNSFLAWPAFKGNGLRVATADINGDGATDLVLGAGPGGATRVNIVDGRSLAPLDDFFAFDPYGAGGVFVG